MDEHELASSHSRTGTGLDRAHGFLKVVRLHYIVMVRRPVHNRTCMRCIKTRTNTTMLSRSARAVQIGKQGGIQQCFPKPIQ